MHATHTRTRLGAAIDELSGAIRTALESRDSFRLADHAAGVGGAALRVLGADALTPYLLGGHRLTRADIEAVEQSRAACPNPPPGVAPEVWHQHEWALARALYLLDAGPAPSEPAAEPDRDPEPEWVAFTGYLLPLCSLALPGLDSPIRRAVRRRRADVARGVTRAIMRRDPGSAARLARWLALDPAGDPELYLVPALAHIAALAPTAPAAGLQVAIARALLAKAALTCS